MAYPKFIYVKMCMYGAKRLVKPSLVNNLPPECALQMYHLIMQNSSNPTKVYSKSPKT